ncbi:hypothetical protein ACHAW5_010312 [Stephanodiscus triporus]|uniref:BCNT-C domain-containing protein n=1 Tax=Stephanodiscus triporus TaxID=2934178 RepID=A0ABD3NGZ0_9STRA
MGDDGDDDDDNDDEEEDEDYVPDADPDDENDENDDGVPAAIRDAPTLSAAKRKAVDDAFRDLFGFRYRYGGQDGHPPPPRDDDECDDDSHSPPPSKRRGRASTILSAIFGPRASGELERRAGHAASFARPRPPSSGGMIRLEKRVVVEVRRFAGQEIRVERVVTVPVMSGDAARDDGATGPTSTTSTSSSVLPVPASGRAGRRGGVDDLLAEISRPEKLSAISKTSADWDLFKAKNADSALGEQLESQARGNEAYLVKRDFLTRVDHRRFELERAERDRERAKRGK